MPALEASNEKVTVDTREVDRIGGAKPEPEERPAFTTVTVEGGAKADGPGRALEMPKSLTIEATVQELAVLQDKFCGNCKLFNHALGQFEINRIGRGDPHPSGNVEPVQERAMLTEIFAHFQEAEDGGGEIFAPVDDIFAFQPAERALAQYGVCEAMKGSHPPALVHPHCHCAGLTEGLGDLWVPKDEAAAQAAHRGREALFGVASGKTP